MESILILFKERKKETPNSFFYERKFSRKYKITIIYISDYLSLSNHKLANKLNNVIKDQNISVFFESFKKLLQTLLKFLSLNFLFLVK